MADSFFNQDEDLRAPPSAADEELMAARNARYQESRQQALGLQAIRDRNARSDMPPGSPTQYLDTYGNKLGPIQRDDLGVTMPAPLGNTGLRGYPGQDELTGPTAAARDRYNANVAAAFPTGISGPLGNAANVNFASKDDALNLDVNNAVGRYPSAPRFNMPSTDQLIDAGIQSKRNAIQNEINTRLVHLGQLPPSVIGASGTTLDSEQAPVTSVGRHGQTRYGASQADRTRAELAILQHSASNLDRAQAGVIQQNSRLALQNAKDNESLSQDMARGQVVDFLSNIDDSRYPHGSPDRQQFIGKVFGSRPDWLHVMAKDPHLSKYVQDHLDAQDKVGQTLSQLKALYPDMEVNPSAVNAKGGVSYKVGVSAEDKAAAKDQAKLEARLHSQTGLTPDEFSALPQNNAQAGGIVTTDSAGKKIFHIEGGGFNVNGTPKGEFSNDFTNFIDNYQPGKTQITPEQERDARSRIATSHAIQIDTGKGYKSVIPRTDYERYLNAFSTEGGEGPTVPGARAGPHGDIQLSGRVPIPKGAIPLDDFLKQHAGSQVVTPNP